MSPATVDDRDGEAVQVVTFGDVWRVVRWLTLPVIGWAAVALIARTNMRHDIMDNSRRIAAESLSIVDVQRTVAGLHSNLDSSLSLQRSILQAVTHKR